MGLTAGPHSDLDVHKRPRAQDSAWRLGRAVRGRGRSGGEGGEIAQGRLQGGGLGGGRGRCGPDRRLGLLMNCSGLARRGLCGTGAACRPAERLIEKRPLGRAARGGGRQGRNRPGRWADIGQDSHRGLEKPSQSRILWLTLP